MLHSIIEMQTPFNMIVLVVLLATLAYAIGVIAKQIRIFLVIREELNFKRDLASQGVPTPEIERLMASHNVVFNSTDA